MRERKILIVVILVVTVFAVSVAPPVQRWWKKDAGVTATAGVKDENISVPTKVTFDYANFDAEIRNHKSMTITLDHYGTIHKDRNYELGTVENPFIILEVVPFEGYAEFGYLIPGCEPISFDRANVKYVNSIQDANNIAIQFNTMVTGNPVRVEEGIGYAEYYSRPTADTNLEGEVYPKGHLAASDIGNVYGKFVKSSNGAYRITGSTASRDIRAEYVGSGGNYDFEILEGLSFDYVEDMREAYLEEQKADSVILSRKLSDWNNIYAYCEGRYGRFERVWDNSGDYYLDWPGGAPVSDVKVTKLGSAGGGNCKFVEKEDPAVPYDGFYDDFYGDLSVPVYNADGVQTETAVLPKNAPHDWQRTYAYFNGKFGYFCKSPDRTGNIKLEGTGLYCSKIRVDDNLPEWEERYQFVEESGVISYFDEGVADAAISFERDGGRKEETIKVSYSLGSQDGIFASLRYYRPKEYHYFNEQTDFLKQTLTVDDSEIKDYQIKVLTVTPDVLNAFAERGDWNLVDAADYITFNDTNHVAGALQMWGKYYNEDFFSPTKDEVDQIADGSFAPRTFVENDISWAVAMRMLCKISILQDEDFPYAPLGIPFNCYKLSGGEPYFLAIPGVRYFADDVQAPIGGNIGTINNVIKLYRMLQVFETDEDAYFYNHFVKNGKVVEKELTLELADGSTKKVTTGYFTTIVENGINKSHASKEDLNVAALYWDDRTFLDVEGVYYHGAEDENHLNGNNQSEILWKWSNMIPIFLDDNGAIINGSVRNNVYTYNNDNAMTIISGTEFFDYKDSVYAKDPFEIIEFCDRDKLTAFDIMYYLLNKERSSLNVLINGSLSSKVYSNVDYESDNVQIALEVGQIVKKEDKLYGRVQFNVKLNTRKGDETDLSSALVQFNIYREDIFDDQTTMELENMIPVTEAYLLTELAKDEAERKKTRLKLGVDYYYDVPLELLQGTIVDGKLKATTTEDVKFSAVVCYGLKDREQGIGNTEEDYKFKKNIYSYVFEQDANGKITKVKKDDRKTLTFVRRAMFNLD